MAPETEKASPEIAAEFTVTGVVPVEVRFTPCHAGEPTFTLFHDRLAGLTLRAAVVVAPVAVPLSLTTAVGLDEELLEIASWPFMVPAVVGRNCTVSIAL